MMQQFNPNGSAIRNNKLFGLPYSLNEAKTICLPFCFDATSSFNKGSSASAQHILDLSTQLDICIDYIPELWKNPLAMAPICNNQVKINSAISKLADEHILSIEESKSIDASKLNYINKSCMSLFNSMIQTCKNYLDQNKKLILLGGEHSVSYSLLKALNKSDTPSFGILHFDSHLDGRDCYQGFEHSHASIMHKAKTLGCVKQIISVGIRDYCNEEKEWASCSNKHSVYYQHQLDELLFTGKTWDYICQDILNNLPDYVYISIDVDVLDAAYVGNTGTPVSGGLSPNHLYYFFKKLYQSNKVIIAGDIVETGSHHLDVLLSARLLMHLWALISKQTHI